MHNSVTAFDHLLVQAAAVEPARQQQLVDAFVADHPVSPLSSGDRAIIFYTGPGSSVVLRGDMLGDRSQPLERLGQTTLWFYDARYEPDARLDYHLLVDGVDIGDARNPRRMPSGYGPRVELRMPEYRDAELWRSQLDVPTGAIQAVDDVSSQLYPSTRTVWIYTPAGYDPSLRYPSVYFQDGGDYLSFAGAHAIFDNLIAAGDLPPCIAVLINPSNEHGRVADYDLNRDYCRFVAEELVPWVDDRYATERTADRRAIIGPSFGGLISLLTAHLRPDVFGLVGSQSGFVSRNSSAIIQLYAQPAPLTVDLIIGTYELEVGAPQTTPLEADFLRANRQLRDTLVAHGYRYAYAEYHEGHSWGLWRAKLGDTLRFLLRV